MADRSVRFDFLGRDVSASRTANKVARDFDSAADKAERAGGRAGSRFFKGFGDGVDEHRGGIGGFLTKLVTPNPELLEKLKHTFAHTFSTPLGLGIAAAIGQALVVALPPAILAASGVGLVALGAFALRGSKILQKHFKAAGTVISESLRQAAKPLEGPFLRAIETVAGAMKQLQPQFRGLFKGIAPSVQPLVNALVGFTRNVLDGLQAALPGINAALQAMAARAPQLGKDIGGFLAAISENLPAIQRGVGIMFSFAGALVNVAGAILTLGQKASDAFANVGSFLSKVKEYTFGLHDGQKKAASSAGDLADSEGRLAIEAQKTAMHHQLLVDKVKTAKQAFYQERAAVSSVIPMFEGYQAKSGVTKQKIMTNLRQEVGAYRTWAKDAQTLIKRGADPEVVRQLSLKGPEYVHAFVGASDKELASMKGMMKARIQAAGTIAKIQGRIMGVEIGKAIALAIQNAFHPRLVVPPPAYMKAPPAARGAYGPAAGHRRAAFASGTNFAPGGMALVGERGPEVVNLPRGSQVIPNHQIGMGGNVTVNVYAHPASNPKEVGAEVYKVLKAYMSSNRTASLA